MKGGYYMSCTFWIRRKRLAAQKKEEQLKTEQAKKPIKKAGGKRDKQGNSKP